MLPIVFAYNFSNERLEMLKKALAYKNFRCNVVEKEEYAKTLFALTGYESEKEDTNRCEFTEEMLLLVNFSGSDINSLIKILKKCELSIPLKAVLTSENGNWNSYTLYTNISNEHKMMVGNNGN